MGEIFQLHSLYIVGLLVRILQLHSRKIGRVIDKNFTITQYEYWRDIRQSELGKLLMRILHLLVLNIGKLLVRI